MKAALALHVHCHPSALCFVPSQRLNLTMNWAEEVQFLHPRIASFALQLAESGPTRPVHKRPFGYGDSFCFHWQLFFPLQESGRGREGSSHSLHQYSLLSIKRKTMFSTCTFSFLLSSLLFFPSLLSLKALLC